MEQSQPQQQQNPSSAVALSKLTKSALQSARQSEVQAIAIYQAEIFWTKNKIKRELLNQIYFEEISHDDSIKKWVELSRLSLIINQFAGFILGSVLSLLPWKLLCKVQSWAETQAGHIYAQAAYQVKNDPIQTSEHPKIIEALEHAQEQEYAHAKTFSQEAQK